MKPSSRAKIRACRLNGALSCGPITEERKRCSSLKWRHPWTLFQTGVLPNESREASKVLVQQYFDHLGAHFADERQFFSMEKRIPDEKIPKTPQIWEEIMPEFELSENSDKQTAEQTQTAAADGHFDILSNLECRLHNFSHKALHRFVAIRRGSPNPVEKCISDLEPN